MTTDRLDAQGNVRDDSVCQAHYDGPADPNCADCERDRLEWEATEAEINADLEMDANAIYDADRRKAAEKAGGDTTNWDTDLPF